MVQAAVETQPQRSFEEETIDDDQLERELEKHLQMKAALEPLKAALKQPRKDFKEKDIYVKERIKALAKSLEIPIDQPIRIGRFTVIRHANDESEISFTRGASIRMDIKLAEQPS